MDQQLIKAFRRDIRAVLNGTYERPAPHPNQIVLFPGDYRAPVGRSSAGGAAEVRAAE